MAEGFITRKGGAVTEQVSAPTITQVSLDETNITFTIKNNDTSSATIVYRISSSTADGESFTLAADTTSANITIGGLDDNTSYTIFASANVEGKIKSDLTEFPFTTPELITFIEATGGTTTTYEDNGTFYKSHTFTSSGNFVVNSLSNQPNGNDVDYLIIAGGGGGGGAGARASGGGGAGGYRTTVGTSGGNSTAESKITVTAQTYGVTIGAGGSGAPDREIEGSNGANSSVFNITSNGGGGGGSQNSNVANGKNGGSGGGAGGQSGDTKNGGSGISGQGFSGGDKPFYSTAGAGGGGAGEAGQDTQSSTSGGNGGDGLGSIIRNGTIEYRGGGGGGAGEDFIGLGGLGGGADSGPEWTGTSGINNPTSGEANTGGGGGGNTTNGTAGSGGSGIVIIRYEVGAL